MGKAIKSVMVYLLTFLVFKILLQEVGMAGWSSIVISMMTAVPVCILAMLVASMLIRPSLFKEQAKKLKQSQKD